LLVLLCVLLGCDDDDRRRDASAGDDAAIADGGDGRRDDGGADSDDRDAGRGNTSRDDGGDGPDEGRKRDAGDHGSGGHHGDNGADAGDAGMPDASHDAPAPFYARVISTGYAHACAITPEGALYCWGQNSFGQLGVDDTDARNTPARVGHDSDWSAVSAGRYHTCAIRGGALYCWGANGFAQLAIADAEIGEQHAPALIAEPERTWAAVSAGDWHTCALDEEGALYCWGYDLLGRLGIGKGLGTTADPGEAIATPTPVDEAHRYTAIDAGASHTCGVRDDGGLWCWGLADRGQLGAEAPDTCELNAVPTPCSVSPLHVDADDAWSEVAVGGAHTCALSGGGALFCFGDNQFGQLGIGDAAMTATPTEVAGDYVGASASAVHTCALRDDDRLACFGSNEAHQLGLAGDGAVNTPERVARDVAFDDVSASALCTCAVATDGAAFCWGTCAYAPDSTPSHVVAM
jgi:alpha-tubulin suppressor-like RCC1 family protein